MCVEYPIVSTCMLYYVCDRRVDSNGLASQARSQNFKIHFISQNGCLGLIRVSHHEHITLSRGHMPGNIWGRSQTTLTSLCLFFDPLPPYVDIFYLINVDKNWTTYPLLLVNVVCERPLAWYVYDTLKSDASVDISGVVARQT